TPAAPRCPFLGSCAYWQQYKAPGNRIGAAEQLFNPNFLAGGDIIVVDDADLPRSLVQRNTLSADALQHSIDLLQGDRWEAARRLLTVALHAVVDAPRRDGGNAGRAL